MLDNLINFLKTVIWIGIAIIVYIIVPLFCIYFLLRLGLIFLNVFPGILGIFITCFWFPAVFIAGMKVLTEIILLMDRLS